MKRSKSKNLHFKWNSIENMLAYKNEKKTKNNKTTGNATKCNLKSVFSKSNNKKC